MPTRLQGTTLARSMKSSSRTLKHHFERTGNFVLRVRRLAEPGPRNRCRDRRHGLRQHHVFRPLNEQHRVEMFRGRPRKLNWHQRNHDPRVQPLQKIRVEIQHKTFTGGQVVNAESGHQNRLYASSGRPFCATRQLHSANAARFSSNQRSAFLAETAARRLASKVPARSMPRAFASSGKDGSITILVAFETSLTDGACPVLRRKDVPSEAHGKSETRCTRTLATVFPLSAWRVARPWIAANRAATLQLCADRSGSASSSCNWRGCRRARASPALSSATRTDRPTLNASKQVSRRGISPVVQTCRSAWEICASRSAHFIAGSQSACGGETGIRTLETVSRLHAFQACAFDHSATSPANAP